jgi:hypothetical protein
VLRTLASPRDTAEVLTRLRTLRPDAIPRWGRMSADQMVCHLRDAFLMGTDEKPVSEMSGLAQRTVIKWIALYAPVRWPSGIATRPEIDQRAGGTRPSRFEADIGALEKIVERVTSDPGFFRGRRHPIFGRLSERGWLRWSYLHMDHHLRQFGV